VRLLIHMSGECDIKGVRALLGPVSPVVPLRRVVHGNGWRKTCCGEGWKG